MCGIAGIASVGTDLPIDPKIVCDMTRAIMHRGPDEEGFLITDRVGLGSRRLSIIDLEGGRQPISNEDDTISIVFNGEVYNYRELRAYLRKQGHRFRTQTDTETILHLYEDLGIDCVQYLDGIFAFAIWDSNRQVLFLARDRMGVKPLYYAEIDGQLVFGSELKVLLHHPRVARDIDLIALGEYLSYEYVPSPRTILRSVKRLEPGYALTYDRRGIRKHQYWQLSLARSEARPPVHWRDYARKTRELLRDTVRKELVSDVPVGVLLSGGIDSSAIAALMVEVLEGAPVQSFSVGFDEPSFDESQYARLASSRLGTQHHEFLLTSQHAAQVACEIASFLDEPFGDSSFIPTFLLARFAAQHVKVVLGGDGGDELFGGYPTLKAHRLIEYYERVVPWGLRARLVPRLLGRMAVSFDNISLDFRMRRFLLGRGAPLLARHHRWLGSFLDEEMTLLLQDWLRPILRGGYETAYRHGKACDATRPLNQILYDDLKMYLEGDILFKVDRASMAASLEVRVPFLNREVVDFACELPMELKLRRMTSKYILRKSFADVLPKAIIRRGKKGFNMPVAQWLAGDLRDLTFDMLAEDRLRRQGLFNPLYVRHLLDEHLSRSADHRKPLWTLLVFQLWHQRFLEL